MKKLTTAVVLSIIAMTALPAASADRPAPASGATEARAAAQNAVEKREKAEKDENGLLDYFKKHKKRYVWDTPRYKGIAYRTRSKDDIKAVRKTVKGLPFSAWGDRLRTIFNKDSVLRIKVVKGLFRNGDNALVDRMVFKKDTMDTPVKDYPFVAVYGKKLKAPKELDDVRSLVLADYQEELERKWVAQLRKRFPFTVDRNVLSTVNKH